MSERPERVRVTGPPRRRPTSAWRPRSRQIDAQTELGRIYLHSLLREQLRRAATTLSLLVLTIGSLPLVFYAFPAVAEVRLLGFPLPYVVLGVGVYPFLVLVGWRHLRAAERNEAAFAELVEARELT